MLLTMFSSQIWPFAIAKWSSIVHPDLYEWELRAKPAVNADVIFHSIWNCRRVGSHTNARPLFKNDYLRTLQCCTVVSSRKRTQALCSSRSAWGARKFRPGLTASVSFGTCKSRSRHWAFPPLFTMKLLRLLMKKRPYSPRLEWTSMAELVKS